MYRLIRGVSMVDTFSPAWFYGKDLIFDAISTIVLFLISYFSFRCYRIAKEKKTHLYLSISFLMMALAFIAKIIVNYGLYFMNIGQYAANIIQLTQPRLWSSTAPYTLGVLVFRMFTLFGLYLLYRISEKKGISWSDHAVMVYLIAILVYFTQNLYYVFHATALVLLCFIVYNYMKLYLKNKNINTKTLAVSFGLLALSHAIFFFMRFDFRLYVIAEAIQLIAFIILLVMFIMVLNHGKKKKQARHNK